MISGGYNVLYLCCVVCCCYTQVREYHYPFHVRLRFLRGNANSYVTKI
jgi:hypothetical protein